MNCNIYFYEVSKKGLSQYPDNYTKDLINEVVSSIDGKGQSQIAFIRNSELIYFVYNHSITKKEHFGICLEYNKVFPCGLKYMFNFFESIISDILGKGTLLYYTDSGSIKFSSDFLYKQSSIIEHYSNYIQTGLDDRQAKFKQLPPNNYGVDNAMPVYFLLEETFDITKTLSNNRIVIVTKGIEAYTINSYRNVIGRLNNKILDLKKQNAELEKSKNKLMRQKHNMTWVAILGFVIIIFGVILWNKVLFPSEVTRYNTGEFVYYGPMKNRKPHGIGVAIYPEDDSDMRRFYIGNFVDGKRQDDEAMLLYRNGDYFYGKMEGDEWMTGVFYKNSTHETFRGEFGINDGIPNCPYNGVWYNEERHHDMKGGVPDYSKDSVECKAE